MRYRKGATTRESESIVGVRRFLNRLPIQRSRRCERIWARVQSGVADRVISVALKLLAPSAIDPVAELHLPVWRAASTASTTSAAEASAAETTATATTTTSAASEAARTTTARGARPGVTATRRGIARAEVVAWLKARSSRSTCVECSGAEATGPQAESIVALRNHALAQSPVDEEGFIGAARIRSAHHVGRFRLQRIVPVLDQAQILEALILIGRIAGLRRRTALPSLCDSATGALASAATTRTESALAAKSAAPRPRTRHLCRSAVSDGRALTESAAAAPTGLIVV